MVQFFLCDHIYIGLGLHLANHAQWVEKVQTMSLQNFIAGATGDFFSIFKKSIPTKNFDHRLFSVLFEFMTNYANKLKHTFIDKKMIFNLNFVFYLSCFPLSEIKSSFLVGTVFLRAKILTAWKNHKCFFRQDFNPLCNRAYTTAATCTIPGVEKIFDAKICGNENYGSLQEQYGQYG